ncbi:MAG: 4-oxalocrotonate tautomerase [Methanomicrobiales archaeon HGW-Methanomicrobiales-4]|nr:MAG: 4-oxalocrotonate tautomerase [Methanomicrobiales archaeon HGW-Methanomicrobiales-4]
MPVISVERGPSTAEVKSELIKKLTKTAAEITKIPESAFVILIKEYPVDAIGVGGIPLSERV